ncbi:hypothetical protein EST38_g9334 [Candolleomyces aberdarensis]|uniref:T6SS Phospholipase effector Tle1-like catalytic domain-containing protein n=1 Tax=Candolleomyces aberdarensis TaxID=2316362 RepID=A0A4Q2DB06_9AGAR|nr:hypothetical protein EST38_g9334 [Candolleomyces aberdarensis]
MACGHRIGGRNLVLCIDGTANQFGKKNTNVIELYNLVMKDTGDNQHTWYNSGIGTYARPHWASFKYRKQVVVHTIDLTIAWNFDKTILAAYEWLADNYQDGDCIFLFVRTNFTQTPKTDLPEDGQAESTMVERLMRALGLAKKESQLRQEGRGKAKSGTQKPEAISMAERFIDKRAFSRRNVKVHFVGAWDTVSSIGVMRGKRMLPGTVDGMTHVCYFRHALALDERRVKFQPEYAWGGTTLPPCTKLSPPGTVVEESNTEVGRNGRDRLPPHILEAWFAGTHSDIGGGNAKNVGMDRSRPPSRWMASEAEKLGLRLKPFDRELSASEQIEFQESLKGFWHLFELLPFRRPTFARSTGAKPDTFVPHLWSARKIHAGQKIHSSLILAESTAPYIPKARPPLQKAAGVNSADGSRLFRSLLRLRRTGTPRPDLGVAFWEDLRADKLANSNGWLEVDLVDHTRLLLKRLVDGTEVKAALTELVSKYHAAQTIYDETMEAIRPIASLEVKCRLLSTGVATLEGHWQDLKFDKWHEIRDSMVDLLRSRSDAQRQESKQFLRLIIANSKARAQAVCDWMIEAIRLWKESPPKLGDQHGDLTALEVRCQLYLTAMEILEGHWQNLKFDKRDPLIVGGTHHQAAKQFLRRITATSRDGAQAVYDETVKAILLWKENPPELGAQYGVLLTAIVVLEGDLESLKLRMWREIWNALADSTKSTNDHQDVAKQFLNRFTTDVNCLFELRGHTQNVTDVAISPDSKHIVSASYGGSSEGIRIWDLETGAQVGGPLNGHTDWLQAVAISPDGKRIVSCSQDKTIQIWDAATGAQVGEPLRGHEGTVWSVTISPDGKRIVSGSKDHTIRIWDLETGAQVGEPLRGHTDEVYSVAISPDGKHIVSGSADGTIRVWNAETGAQVGEPLRGHTKPVASVAISPDGKRIVSGSGDKTIRVWDAEPGAQVGEPLRGHTDPVYSVAISPDGKHIVSGSFDRTIRIWDLETGAQVGEPLRGHTGEVNSVAISPDGKRIVSGADEGIIRIWSAEGILV